MKHKKGIIDRQFELKRVAEIVMDLYGMAAVCSRASSALSSNSPTAKHESLIAQAFCQEADERISQKILALKNAKGTSDSKLEQIADQLFDNKVYIPEHPLKL